MWLYITRSSSKDLNVKCLDQSTKILPKMCAQASQLAVKAEMKVCHVSHMGAFQETDSADTHAVFGLFLTSL